MKRRKKNSSFFFRQESSFVCNSRLLRGTSHLLISLLSFSSFFLECVVPSHYCHISLGEKKRKENKDVVMVGGKSQDSAQEGGPIIKQKCGFIIQIQALGGIFITKFGITKKTSYKVFFFTMYFLAPGTYNDNPVVKYRLRNKIEDYSRQ